MNNEKFLLRGKQFEGFIKFVLSPNFIGDGCIHIPKTWVQPLVFYKDTIRLYQRINGPCGVLAVLQSYIILNHKFDPYLGVNELLALSIINIMDKLNPGIYSICTELDDEENMARFYSTNDREAFKKFLLKSNFFTLDNSLFYLTLSFAYNAGPQKLSSYAIHESFIDYAGNTDLHFVLLLLTGKPLDDVSDGFRICGGSLRSGVCEQAMIGLIQLHENKYDIVATGRNITYPFYKIWVMFNGSHFYAMVLDGDKLLMYDPFFQDETVDYIEITPKHYQYEILQKIQEKFNMSFMDI